jgi:hypothetical protein
MSRFTWWLPASAALVGLVLLLAGPVAAGLSSDSLHILPTEKQAYLDRIEAQYNEAFLKLPPDAKSKDAGVPDASVSEDGVYLDPHFPLGSGMVVDSTDGPPGDDSIIVTSIWARTDPFVVLYAGSDAKDPSVGVVVLYDETTRTSQRYSSSGHGPLQLSGGSDDRIELHGSAGELVFFDPQKGFE